MCKTEGWLNRPRDFGKLVGWSRCHVLGLWSRCHVLGLCSWKGLQLWFSWLVVGCGLRKVSLV